MAKAKKTNKVTHTKMSEVQDKPQDKEFELPKPKEPEKFHMHLDEVSHKEIVNKLERLHEECPRYQHCTKREFLIGLGLGILVGVIAIKIFEAIIK